MLSEAVEAYGNVDTELLTAEAKASYEGALEAVLDLIAAEDLDIRDQADIDKAAEALEDAYFAIEYKEANVEALQERYDAALKVDMDSLTDESREALESAMADVKALLDEAEAGGLDIRDQEAIDQALDALTETLAALEKKPVEENPGEEKPGDDKPTGDADDGQKPQDGPKKDAPDKDKAVKTGDTADLGLILMLAAVSAAAAVLLRRKSRAV